MKKAIVRRTVPDQLATLADNLHPILTRIYHARGVQTADELDQNLVNLLPYESLSGIKQAANYLAATIIQEKRILIIGDFDADGATSTAVAVSALRAFGCKNVNFLVPNRFEYGYGLTPEIVELAAQSKPDVIITVDNGISSLAGVEKANSLGIKVIVTDHHLPGNQLPAAEVIVNPQVVGDQFPSKNLAGVGVIFYVMLALRSELRTQGWFEQQKITEPNMAQFLDLVCLGTVADLVPLDRNNRILVSQGLQRIRSGKTRPGITALLASAGKAADRLVAADLGFLIAPRLNAAGRLSDMSLGIECLLCEDLNRAKEMAARLDSLNEERRVIENTMQQQARSAVSKAHRLMTDEKNIPLGICLFEENWHQGVVGLVAARIKDYLHRPVIAFALGETGELKGSGRSIHGLHLRDVLAVLDSQHPGLIVKFGGHAMAAGLTIKRSSYETFSNLFAEEVRRQIDPVNLQGAIYTDGVLTPNDFTLALAEQLRAGGPWGQAFPEPVFDGTFRLLHQRLLNNKHLKLLLGLEDSKQQFDAIMFNVDINVWPNHRLEKVTAAYRLDVNEYLGSRKLQLIIEYLQI